jgi:type I restriction enzyme M protein
MLDIETKRRINTCRDILVGKVPDPKSQVEQITIALIYKFMDDMDLQAEELGGVRSFFTGEYERYAWAKLVSPGVGGQEMLNTYTEALTKMVENPDIPELFRSIFRNAYLPYRDPETLRSFLREINGFTYDHSERLGDAFEYLLSVLGSQGDAGQFRTPRHIIDFMVEIIDPKKDEIILDPACGTAGFLISSYKHILMANTTEVEAAQGTQAEVDAAEAALESPLRYSGDLLLPEDRQRLANNIKGYDISPDMVRLSLVNLYLHGFADPNCEEYDTLTSEDKWGQTADVILANPPFMSPKGGIKPHNRFGVPSKRSEVLFVDYIAEHLTPNGRAAIVVPEGIIFQSQSAYCDLRKMLVTKHLVAVISLPAGVFNPYSGVKTSILILDRAAAKASKSVAFFRIENDGFGLGAQRRAVKGGQLGQVKAELGAWLAALRGSGEAVLDTPLGFAVEKKRIAEGGEYNLSGERYREGEARRSVWPLVNIGEVCNLINGRAFKPTDWEAAEKGGLPIIRIQNLNNPAASLNYFSGEVKPQYLVEPGELLFSWSGSRGTSFGAHIWQGNRAILNQHIFRVLFDPNVADKLYLLRVLNAVVDQVEDNLHGGVGLVHITKGNLEKIQIPMPPLEVQREIVAEIEGYQKVIDGARTVLENYRPHIPIDPAWPIVELGEACERIMDGTHFSPSNSSEGERLYITSKNVRDGYLDLSNVSYISEVEHQDIFRRCPVNLGDVLYTKDGSNTGFSAINTIEGEFSLLSSVAVLRGKSDVLENRYLSYYLNSGLGRQKMLALVSGVAITRLTLTKIGHAKIPLPPLETQQAIVAEIEAEQALVNANRDLITRFETKIEAAIARVWGGAEEAAAA